jgi:hypothetical protein
MAGKGIPEGVLPFRGLEGGEWAEEGNEARVSWLGPAPLSGLNRLKDP